MQWVKGNGIRLMQALMHKHSREGSTLQCAVSPMQRECTIASAHARLSAIIRVHIPYCPLDILNNAYFSFDFSLL